MLQHASIEAACGNVSLLKYGSVSFPRFAGEGRDGGQRTPSKMRTPSKTRTPPKITCLPAP